MKFLNVSLPGGWLSPLLGGAGIWHVAETFQFPLIGGFSVALTPIKVYCGDSWVSLWALSSVFFPVSGRRLRWRCSCHLRSSLTPPAH